MHAILRFFSSLKLVITCLVFAMIIVVFGTLEQVDIGIQNAQKKYFDQLVISPQRDGALGGETFNNFIQSLPASGIYSWIFKTVPLPGGYLVGGVMLAGLIASYFTRFKVGAWRVAVVTAICVVETWAMLQVGYATWPGWLLMLAVTVPNLALVAYAHYKLRWPKVGVMLTHLGIVIMLVGGLLTSLWQRETRMIITTGETATYSASDMECEIAIVSDAGDGQEDVVAIPQSLLDKGGTITLPNLPFAVKVRTFMRNSDLLKLAAGETPPHPVTEGYGKTHKASPIAPASKMDERNFMAAYVDLVKDGQPVGTYLVSLWGELFQDKLPAQNVEVGGKTYALRMRPARFYKPFSLTLLKFSHDKYKGTEKPRNFSSLVKLKDPRSGEESTRLIKMNEPLRYEGETFFQASFLPGDRTTILQVVKNPAAWLPYVSCVVVSLGMMLQFLVHLIRFTQKRATKNTQNPSELSRGKKEPRAQKLSLDGERLVDIGIQISVLPPEDAVQGNKLGKHMLVSVPVIGTISAVDSSVKHSGISRWLPRAVLLCAVIGFLMSFMPPKAKTEIKVREFGALPVLVKGRIQPWDSLARNALLSIREVSDFNDRDLGVKMSASEWLLEAMCKPAEANARKVFKVDELDLKTLLGAENKAVKFFSANEIAAKLNDLREVLKSGTETTADGRMRQKKTSELTPYQKAAQQLWRKFNYYLVIQNALHVADTQTFQAQMEQVLSGAEQEPAKDKFSWETELSRYEQFLPKDFASIHAQPGKDELTKEQRIYFVFVQRYKQLQEEAAFGENAVGITPSAKNPDEFDTLFESLTKAVFAQKVDAGVRNYSRMVTAYQRGDASAFNTALTDQQTLLAAAPGVLSTAKHERIFNDADPFNFTITLYVCVLLLSLFSWLGLAQPIGKATRWLLVFTFALHTAGIITRIVLIDRPPVINLYSAAVFVGWGAAGLALLLEFYFRGCIASAAAAMVGFGTLIIASHKALEGDTLEMMQAVLDSNFWLATHVVIINLGYSATYLAGTLGILYVLRGVFTPSLDEELGKKLERSVYAITCFAALFSFTGTVLGGIWADQSWGRFWGWDPKENGALLIVLWCLVILHARWGRYMEARGLMAAAIFGNIVTSISFFGTNMLDIGLHSYGRSENGALRLWQFSLSQLVLIAIALLPFKWWRSGKQLAKTT